MQGAAAVVAAGTVGGRQPRFCQVLSADGCARAPPRQVFSAGGARVTGMSELSHQEVFSDFSDLVVASPTSYHAAESVAARLEAAGFTRLGDTDDWAGAAPNGRVVVRDGAVIAWRTPEQVANTTPFRVVVAHTDSPGFRLKPVPSTERAGWCSLNAEIYGGPLTNSWLDRDLRLAGRLVLTDGSTTLVATEPVARIPQLAIHLDRRVNADGLKLDQQQHTHAVLGLAEVTEPLQLLAKSAGVAVDDIRGFDIFFVDSQAPARLGARGELIASGRMDNLASVWAGTRALIDSQPADGISVLAAFDHEEVGSSTRTGAAGPLLGELFERIQPAATAHERGISRAASWVVSSDVGHAVHPNYPERHDDAVRPIAGQGPIIKVNADQRYVTDGAGEALWRQCSEAAGVAVQWFVSNNTMPCGSTVGPFIATRFGIRTVDVGIPILSMHSVRELAVLEDLDGLGRVLGSFMVSAQ